MKKGFFIVTLAFLSLFMTSAKAVELTPYVGVDAGYVILTNVEGVDENKGPNYGVNAGLKVGSKLFTSLELSYKFGDIIDEKFGGGMNYNGTYEAPTTLTLTETFGGKLYLGYNFTKDFSTFIDYGFNQYKLEQKSSKEKEEETKFLHSFGFGFGYVFANHVELKLSYDYVLKNQDLGDTNMHQFRCGVNYLF